MTTQIVERKPIFDAFRAMLGRGLTQAEVERLDRAIDAAVGIADDKARTIGPAGLSLIREFEGFAEKLPDGRVQAYPDPGTGGAPWTIGWGSTTDEQGKAITPGTVWTQERADKRFAAHVAEFAEEVAKLVDAKTMQNQFDAITSLAYNIGTRALRTSTLLKLHNAGNHAGAAAEFGKWVKAGGRTLPGLVRRRAAEAALYRG